MLIKNNKLVGYNTDTWGFEHSFVPHLKRYHERALILGNGGAAESVKYVLRHLHIHYTSVTRKPRYNTICYENVDEAIIKAHKIIINTTPLGTYPNIDECPNIPYEFITPQHYLFDLVYNPSVTAFMQKGIQQNAFVKNGYEMLCLQAEENWRIWNDY